MTTYYTFYLSQLGLILVARALGLKNSKILLLMLLTIATCFAGFRGDVGTDTFAYRTFYDFVGYDDMQFYFEPIFLIITLFGNTIGFSSQFLIFSIAMLQGIFIYLTLKRVEEKDLYYLFLISTFFVYIQMNLIRVGLAMYILTYALALKEEQKRVVWPIYITGILTHITTLVTLPLFSTRWYRVLPVVIFSIIIFDDYILSKFAAHFTSGYAIKTDGDYLGIGFFVSIVIIAYCITVEKKWGNLPIRISFLGFALFKMALPLLPILDRISLVFSLPLFMLLLRARVKTQTYLALLLLVVYNTYGSLSFIANSDASIEALIAEHPGFSMFYDKTKWVPYEFFWN